MAEIEKKKDELRVEMKDHVLAFRMMRATVEEMEPGTGNLLIEVMIEELQKLIPPNVMAASRAAAPAACRFTGKNRYIGTKVLTAEPALRIEEGGSVRIELLSTNPMPGPGATVDVGYQVEYPDKYKSWCPQDAFEEAYRPADGLNFGLAIEAAKKGAKIARRGWNGKGMWVVYRTGYPEGIPCNKNTADAVGIPEGTLFKVRPYLQMKCADDSFQMWLASQSDILADDWYIVE